jgi:hypothetical protein
MLHHSVNSPLATLAQRYVVLMRGVQYEADGSSDSSRLADTEAILASSDEDTLGKNLFRLSASADLAHVRLLTLQDIGKADE